MPVRVRDEQRVDMPSAALRELSSQRQVLEALLIVEVDDDFSQVGTLHCR